MIDQSAVGRVAGQAGQQLFGLGEQAAGLFAFAFASQPARLADAALDATLSAGRELGFEPLGCMHPAPGLAQGHGATARGRRAGSR